MLADVGLESIDMGDPEDIDVANDWKLMPDIIHLIHSTISSSHWGLGIFTAFRIFLIWGSSNKQFSWSFGGYVVLQYSASHPLIINTGR